MGFRPAPTAQDNIARADASNAKTRVNELVINAKDYGAIGDGVTDDTVSIAAAIAANPATLFFPAGTYLCNMTLPSGRVRLLGVGPSSILQAQTAASPIVDITGSFTGTDGGRRIEHLKFKGDARQGHGIQLSGGTFAECIVSECVFETCKHAISQSDAGASVIEFHVIGNAFKWCDYGVKFTGNGGHNVNTFQRNRFRFTNLACVYLSGGHGNIFRDNDFSNGDGFGLILKGAANTGQGVGEWNTLQGGWFEQLGENGQVNLEDEGLSDPRAIWLDDNKLQTHGTISSYLRCNNARMKIEHLRSASPIEYASCTIENGSRVEIDYVTADNNGGRVVQSDDTSVLTVKSGHVRNGARNRSQLWERSLPAVNREDVTNHALDVNGELNGDAGTPATYPGDLLLGQKVANISLADEAANCRLNVPVDAAKWYAFGFALKSNTGALQRAEIQCINGGNTFLFLSVNAKSKQWRYYSGVIPGIDSPAGDDSLRFQAATGTGGADYNIAMLQWVEFDTREEAEEWVNQNYYALPPTV